MLQILTRKFYSDLLLWNSLSVKKLDTHATIWVFKDFKAITVLKIHFVRSLLDDFYVILDVIFQCIIRQEPVKIEIVESGIFREIQMKI